jgi:glycosyltransferase involved in cell wall biosynthesis
LQQDYPNIEYIIIDGGSTDNSVEIIKKYQDRLSFCVSEKDNGHSHAINKGFANATGEIFNWLNSDDLLAPSAVSIAVHYLMKHNDVGMVYGDRAVIDQTGNIVSLLEVPYFCPKAFEHHLRIPQETCFIRRNYWEQVNGVDENLHYCMDYDLFIKLSKITRLYHIPFVLGSWRQHECAKTVIFSNGMKESWAEETTSMYFHHYGRTRSRMKKKLFKKINLIRLCLEKQSKSRKNEVKEINKVILQSSDGEGI